MTETTWDPSDTGNWILSNGDLTATSPDNNTQQSVFVAFAQTPIPDDAKTYFEYTVSGAAVETAFTVGFGVHGFNPSGVNLADEGAIIPNATFLGFSYNLGIANSGDVIYDPQNNATYAQTHPGAAGSPNQWPNGSVIGVLVDRIDNTVQFTLNGVAQGGPFDISGIGDKTVYPFAYSWFKSGPVATINGGIDGFAERLPAGYTALDNSGGSSGGGSGSTGPISNPITVNQPSVLTVGEDTIAGHEADPTQPVYLSWHGTGSAPSVGNSDVVRATVNANGNFSATVDVDNAGSQSTMYVGSSGTLTAAWSATPVGAASGGSGSGSSGGSTGSDTGSNLITVVQTPGLTVGEDTIVGSETDPTQPVYLSWHDTGATPSVGNSDVVQATVNANGNFSATVDVDNAGSQSTMYVGSSGALTAAWSATPVNASSSGNGSGSSGGSTGTDTGSNPITVVQPPGLTVGEDSIVGNEADPTQPVYLSWHDTGSAPSVGDNDVVQATVNTNGNFRATVEVDNAGSQSTMYVGNSGTLTAAWSATPVSSGSNGSGVTVDDSVVSVGTIAAQSQGSQSLGFVAAGSSGSATNGDPVTVDQPASLSAGTQNIFGTESDPSQSIFLNWQNYGTPATGDGGWVQATVHGSGNFFDSVDVDNPGVQGTMFYRVGSGPAVAAWSGTPS
jgi:hypothetical protein